MRVGLYNLREQFVEFVLDGSKTHTIRAYRKRGMDSPGNTMHNYTRLRTKQRRLLCRRPCVRVETIVIWEDGSVFTGERRFNRKEDEQLRPAVMRKPDRFGLTALDAGEKEVLAYRDGFRLKTGHFREMLSFWTGRLPFIGEILHWSNEAIVSAPKRKKSRVRRTPALSFGSDQL